MKKKEEDSFKGLDVIMLIKQNDSVIKGNIKQFFFIICVIAIIVCTFPLVIECTLNHFELSLSKKRTCRNETDLI